MTHGTFEIELDGQRFVVRPGHQTLFLLGPEGQSLSEVPIQTAAGSLQGIFSMLDAFTGVKNA